MFGEAFTERRLRGRVKGLVPYLYFRLRGGACRGAVALRRNEVLFVSAKPAADRGRVTALRSPLSERFPIVLRECVAVIPEEALFYKIISVAAGKDVRSVIDEALAAFPFASGDALYYSEPIEPLAADPGHRDFAFWAVSRKYLEEYRRTLEGVGISANDFYPEALGIVELIFPAWLSHDANLVLSVSEERSVFAIFAGRAIHFSGALPFGSRALETNAQDADRFLSEVMQVILYYKNRALHEHGASHHVNRILLIGTLPEQLAERIALNAQIRVEPADIVPHATVLNDAELAPLLGALAHQGLWR